MTNPIGYIIQYFDNDSFLPQQGGKLLYKHWKNVIREANTIAERYIENRNETLEGPFTFLDIQKDWIQTRGSAVFFTSRDITIWIEVVYEN
jgi:hypothetical protein